MPHVGEIEGPGETTLRAVREHATAARPAASAEAMPRLHARAPAPRPAARSLAAAQGVSANRPQARP